MKPSLIVHPVSYSPGGKTALATAIALARVSGAALHVLELTGGRRSSHGPVVRPITDAEVESHFAEFVQSVSADGVKISAVELAGDIVEAVADYATTASADLVVVADQARSHGPYWRRGMYARDLTRHLSIPLVSVPASRGEWLAGNGDSSEHTDVGADFIGVARPGADHQVSMNSRLARVLRNAPRPVLVVPETAAERIRIPLEMPSSNVAVLSR